MPHLPGIVQDLAILLIAASVVTVLFRWLKQPVVLGYILAGLIVGPYFSLFPTIQNETDIRDWGEIGMIFLLFALGLEFSFKKLVRVGGAALLTAVFEVITMIGVGYLTGRALGWSLMDSVFLGGILAISSTTIIIRAFEELGIKGRGFVSLVLGVLIIEDLVAILLLALLSTIAISKQVEGMNLLISMLKLGFFLTIWFLSGIFLIPSALKRVRPLISEESLVIVTLGLCFLMVVLASRAGFSPALGAFMMGSILAETRDAERTLHVVEPIRSLFAAIFFVSVGLNINPGQLTSHIFAILAITVIVVIGKSLSSTIGALLAGQNLRRSLQAGLSLAQIGEFSFIIASLGQSLHVTSPALYPIAVGVSLLTTFLTPYQIHAADVLYARIEKTLPPTWSESLRRYSSSTKGFATTDAWRDVVRAYTVKIAAMVAVIIAVFTVVAQWLTPWLDSQLPEASFRPTWAQLTSFALALLVSAPFFWGLIFSRHRSGRIRELWRQGLYRGPIIALELVRVVIGIALLGIVTTKFINLGAALTMTLVLLIAFLALFSTYLNNVYRWFENVFIENLREREKPDRPLPQLAPWDAHITTITVPANSPAVGESLMALGVRERFGVTIALIERGHHILTAPAGAERLYPHDRISVIGTDEEIAQFEHWLNQQIPHQDIPEADINRNLYGLDRIRIDADSEFCGKTIRESQIREKTQGLVVGLERQGQRILNPESTLRISDGDILWVVGNNRLIRQL